MKSFYNIKLILSYITLSFLCFAAVAQSYSAKMQVSIANGKIKINKKEISKDWKLSAFTKVLDTNFRKKAGTANVVYTYDKFGIVIFEPAKQKIPSGIVSECQFFLDEVETSSSSPLGSYDGKIIIQKIEINKNTSIEEVRKKLKDYTETTLDEYDKYRFSKDGLYLFLVYNEEKKLAKCCVGKEK